MSWSWEHTCSRLTLEGVGNGCMYIFGAGCVWKCPNSHFMHTLLHSEPFNSAWLWNSLADVAPVMATGLYLTLLTDMEKLRDEGRSEGHPISEDTGHWVYTSVRALSCGDWGARIRGCVCFVCSFLIFIRFIQEEKEEEREAKTERTSCKSE